MTSVYLENFLNIVPDESGNERYLTKCASRLGTRLEFCPRAVIRSRHANFKTLSAAFPLFSPADRKSHLRSLWQRPNIKRSDPATLAFIQLSTCTWWPATRPYKSSDTLSLTAPFCDPYPPTTTMYLIIHKAELGSRHLQRLFVYFCVSMTKYPIKNKVKISFKKSHSTSMHKWRGELESSSEAECTVLAWNCENFNDGTTTKFGYVIKGNILCRYKRVLF